MAGAAFSRVLVGWDGSRCAMRALEVAARLTEGASGRLLALAVIPPEHHPEGDEPPGSGALQARRAAVERFEQAVGEFGLSGQERVSLRIIQDRHVAETLAAYAQSHGYDLVVLGRHGREGALHPKLGHVAAHLARTDSVPVLLVSSTPS